MNNKVFVLIALFTCIGLLQTGFSAGQLERSVTLQFRGVIQQNPMSSDLNAIWIQNVVADFLSKDQQAIVQNMLNGGIEYVFVQVGNWHQSSAGVVSIDYWLNTSVMENIVNSIHSYSNNQIQVHAWIFWSIPESQGGVMLNLADSGIRQQCVDVAVNCVQTYGFDGFNDDLFEGYDGSDADYVIFANALGVAMRNINKISSVDLYSPWNGEGFDNGYEPVYSGITEIDYICVMLYGGWADGQWNEGNTLFNLNRALAASGTKLLAGVMVTREPNGFTLTDILSWIEYPTSSKFAGVALFNLLYMQNDDWNALSDWVISNQSPI